MGEDYDMGGSGWGSWGCNGDHPEHETAYPGDGRGLHYCGNSGPDCAVRRDGLWDGSPFNGSMRFHHRRHITRASDLAGPQIYSPQIPGYLLNAQVSVLY